MQRQADKLHSRANELRSKASEQQRYALEKMRALCAAQEADTKAVRVAAQRKATAEQQYREAVAAVEAAARAEDASTEEEEAVQRVLRVLGAAGIGRGNVPPDAFDRCVDVLRATRDMGEFERDEIAYTGSHKQNVLISLLADPAMQQPSEKAVRRSAATGLNGEGGLGDCLEHLEVLCAEGPQHLFVVVYDRGKKPGKQSGCTRAIAPDVSSAARTLPGWDGGADWFMKWCGTRQHLLTTSETVPTAPNAPHQHTCRIDTRRMYAGAVLGSNSGFLAEWDTGTDAWVSQSIVMSSTRLAAVGHTGRTWPVWRDVCVFGPMVWSMLTRVREGMGRVLQWCPGEGVCSTVPAHLKGGAGDARSAMFTPFAPVINRVNGLVDGRSVSGSRFSLEELSAVASTDLVQVYVAAAPVRLTSVSPDQRVVVDGCRNMDGEVNCCLGTVQPVAGGLTVVLDVPDGGPSAAGGASAAASDSTATSPAIFIDSFEEDADVSVFAEGTSDYENIGGAYFTQLVKVADRIQRRCKKEVQAVRRLNTDPAKRCMETRQRAIAAARPTHQDKRKRPVSFASEEEKAADVVKAKNMCFTCHDEDCKSRVPGGKIACAWFELHFPAGGNNERESMIGEATIERRRRTAKCQKGRLSRPARREQAAAAAAMAHDDDDDGVEEAEGGAAAMDDDADDG